MSFKNSLINYYSKNGQNITSNDINLDKPNFTPDELHNLHYYVSPSQIGYYFDMGVETIGQRPVWKQYEVGKATCLSQQKSPVTDIMFNCKQPFWNNKCR